MMVHIIAITKQMTTFSNHVNSFFERGENQDSGFCGKSFIQSIMIDITKYKCNYCDSCGKFFIALGKLKKHIKKIHSSQKHKLIFSSEILSNNLSINQPFWLSTNNEIQIEKGAEKWNILPITCFSHILMRLMRNFNENINLPISHDISHFFMIL